MLRPEIPLLRHILQVFSAFAHFHAIVYLQPLIPDIRLLENYHTTFYTQTFFYPTCKRLF
ncbi:MAG: hypothetical protein FJ266_15670 [Planctomycetes bacterium]|nr:hypothetical protein [Planctomycetota bacterium]